MTYKIKSVADAKEIMQTTNMKNSNNKCVFSADKMKLNVKRAKQKLTKK